MPINPESIMVKWDLPQYPNGLLSGYRIYYKHSNVTASRPGSDGTGYEVNTVQSGTDLKYNISGLDPFTNYSIFVIAVGMPPQLSGRVNAEVLVLTKRGKECYYDNDMHIPPVGHPWYNINHIHKPRAKPQQFSQCTHARPGARVLLVRLTVLVKCGMVEISKVYTITLIPQYGHIHLIRAGQLC